MADNTQGGTIQPPNQWTTGNDPMTEKQAAFLEKLAQDKDVDIDTSNVNKAKASELIDELKAKPSNPTNSSDSTKTDAEVGDTSQWTTGADAATQKQKAYIAVLEKRAGEGVHGLAELSKAEASERIDELRAKTGE